MEISKNFERKTKANTTYKNSRMPLKFLRGIFIFLKACIEKKKSEYSRCTYPFSKIRKGSRLHQAR